MIEDRFFWHVTMVRVIYERNTASDYILKSDDIWITKYNLQFPSMRQHG